MLNTISESDIERLKALDILEVAERLGVDVSDRGNSHCFNSDAHARGDKNPSLSFYDGNTKFKCFACGLSGDTIALVQAYEHIESFPEACRRLAELMGVQLENVQNTGTKKQSKKPNFDYKPAQHEQLRIRSNYRYEKLPRTEVCQALYDATVEPSDGLKKWWLSRGFSLRLLKLAGWKTVGKDTWEKTKKQAGSIESLSAFDRILKAIHGDYATVVPFFDGDYWSDGSKQPTVICVRMRSLNPENKAKYLSPVGLKPIIYGYDRLSEWMIERVNKRTKKPLYVTESETDAIAIRELAMRDGDDAYAVALVGASKNPESLVVRELVKVLKKAGTSSTINIVTDRDDAGENFCNVIGNVLQEAGFTEVYKWQEWDESIKDIGEHLMRLVRGEQVKQIKINERNN